MHFIEMECRAVLSKGNRSATLTWWVVLLKWALPGNISNVKLYVSMKYLQIDIYFAGSFQSPINIDPDSVSIDDTLEKHPLVARYVPENVNTITNTGSTVKVDYDSRGSSKFTPKGRDKFSIQFLFKGTVDLWSYIMPSFSYLHTL